ncbi:SDR family NAD(P)-dependent oxidoreductase [Paraburkholderia ferrariae]|uniref:SDR family oxidoreductase n=1 Tax=Paraburkholderia ferrariae TaxID=386056 RepID=A0ABU9S1S3_9BURK
MKASFDASGDVIVITGGANGIGAALARACAGAGATVIVCDVDEHAAAALLAAEPRLQFVRLDVSDRDAVMAAMQSIENEHGHIDGLVCAAAVQPRRAVHDTAPADWQRTLGINLDGVVWCYQAAMPGMIRRRRGSVLLHPQPDSRKRGVRGGQAQRPSARAGRAWRHRGLAALLVDQRHGGRHAGA